jgi:hypothetical protein
MRRLYWERLFLSTIELSEKDLRAALKHRATDRRFAAAYVVGERLLEWPKDLLPLLEDGSEAVRQAARRSLIILGFLALNPEEAQRIRSAPRNQVATPLSELNKPVDFGPNPGASPAARAQAVKQWRQWWADQEAQRSRGSSVLVAAERGAAADTTEAGQLAAALLHAGPERRPEISATYQSGKGVKFTEALALAIAGESGEERRNLREALNERMARMTEKTLGQYLMDEDAEIRRAAALGLAMRARPTSGT